MLRIVPCLSAQRAETYFAVSDYYLAAHELPGEWRGEGAARLGLAGEIAQEDWIALCRNRHPETGRTLTLRQKENRRIGFDFNFHVPKSVSLVHALGGDERILDAFRESVRETMEAIEPEMKARVRSNGRDEDRVTGNLVAGEFVHLTARPVGGLPDPHLHAHCFVFNATFDPEERRWKAAQIGDIKRDAPFFAAMFHSSLAARLADLGYAIERTNKGWQIGGVPGRAVREFSQRTAAIEARAKALGITDAAQKDRLGAMTRERKSTDLGADALKASWLGRLGADEIDAIRGVAGQAIERSGEMRLVSDRPGVERAVDLAQSHCFERSAVVPQRVMQAEAMKRSYGIARPEAVLAEVGRRPFLEADKGGRRYVTTQEVLAEEQRMLAFARNGRGRCAPLAPHYQMTNTMLNAGQLAAVRHVLESPDRVMLIRGAAGVGKTTMMREAVAGIEAGGHRVLTFAPSAEASRGVLRSEGFASAETLARLLIDRDLQEQARDQVIWVDEAGLIGSKSMAQLFQLADRVNARVVLSGDRRQHGSVERGAPLRLLETEAGVIPAEIREIKRQQGEYKRVVQALSEGRVEHAVRQLDGMGWIREVAAEERYKALAADYFDATAQGSVLVVSPTHIEGDRITAEIRTRLRELGKLGKTERTFAILDDARLTEADRSTASNFNPGDVVVFHQGGGKYRRGERVEIMEPSAAPLDQAASFQLFRPGTIELSAGDALRITRNGKTADGKHRLNNGAIYRVKGFDRDGNIRLANGWTVSRDYGHFSHGYVVTSHASQGRSVDYVLVGQSSASWPASSREQLYVSVSRGKKAATIYTDDKAGLLEAVSEAEDRPTATEFMNAKRERARAILREQLAAERAEPPRRVREFARE